MVFCSHVHVSPRNIRRTPRFNVSTPKTNNPYKTTISLLHWLNLQCLHLLHNIFLHLQSHFQSSVSVLVLQSQSLRFFAFQPFRLLISLHLLTSPPWLRTLSLLFLCDPSPFLSSASYPPALPPTFFKHVLFGRTTDGLVDFRIHVLSSV